MSLYLHLAHVSSELIVYTWVHEVHQNICFSTRVSTELTVYTLVHEVHPNTKLALVSTELTVYTKVNEIHLNICFKLQGYPQRMILSRRLETWKVKLGFLARIKSLNDSFCRLE